ncbi:ABC transporter substrate-binding protein [Siccirubricoccus phaeus]|uniref:ABC transporter substrate-binding protein n=1 Tax=Siccirubricoccus phaeus TaxID=2595053 RepID=UPI0011F3B212|nr:ABC transporter substrate-binding protein [Siccirubricoccus phaeus]
MPRPFRLPRRAALGLLAAPALIPAFGRAQGLKKVSFTLPWVPEGANLIAFVAKANNYWAEEGLDVEISRGTGSTVAAQAIGAGRFDYGCAAASAGLQQAAKGVPVVQIAAMSYDVMMGMAVLADGPVKAPKDIEGRKLASTSSSGDYPFWAPFAAAAGIDAGKVQHSSVDNNVRQRLLVEKQVEGVTGFATTFLPWFAAQNVAVRTFLYSRYGIVFYGNTVMTQKERAEKDPRTTQAMVTGLMKAQKFTLLNPEEALRIFIRAVPEAALSRTAQDQARIGLGLARLGATAEKAIGKPVGSFDPGDAAAMVENTMKYLAAAGDARPDPAAAFTNAFLGGVTMTAEEWAKAQQQAAEFAALVA